MKTIAACLVVALLPLCFPQAADAQYAVGYVQDGYVYGSDGYWHYNGARYVASRTYYAAYYANGCYFPARYSPWVYTPYVAPVPAKPFNMKQALLEMRYEELRQDYELAKAAQEYRETLELIDALGLKRNPKAQQLLASMVPPAGYSLSGHYYQTSTPVQATSIYGYSSSALVKYQDDQGKLILGQLAAGSQAAAEKALAIFASSVQTDQATGAKLAMDKQQLDALVQAIIEVRKSTTSTTSGYAFTVSPNGTITKTPGPTVPMPGAPPVADGLREQQGQLLASACAGCHFGDQIRGKFDVAKFWDMSQQYRDEVFLPRINPKADPKTRMPRGGTYEASTDGNPLSLAQYQLLATPATK